MRTNRIASIWRSLYRLANYDLITGRPAVRTPGSDLFHSITGLLTYLFMGWFAFCRGSKARPAEDAADLLRLMYLFCLVGGLVVLNLLKSLYFYRVTREARRNSGVVERRRLEESLTRKQRITLAQLNIVRGLFGITVMCVLWFMFIRLQGEADWTSPPRVLYPIVAICLGLQGLWLIVRAIRCLVAQQTPANGEKED